MSKKLGISPGSQVLVLNPPGNYGQLLDPPPEVEFVAVLTPDTDVIHLFTASRAELSRTLAAYRDTMRPNATVWVSWPKKASTVPTDITEDVIRDVCLPLGLVDVKVCAVDETWSGLKLVIRKELR